MNLFKVFSPLQQFARSSLWPDDINFRLTAYVYPAYVLLLLLGPQERTTNFGLNLFWCYWWPLSFIIYPFLGRIWCSGNLLALYSALWQTLCPLSPPCRRCRVGLLDPPSYHALNNSFTAL